ncbi:MAG: hypothetical protein LUC50_09355 [Ruminococcus sp.]|nr:hypothetical protein [Ruminococcus sp.]
MKTKTASRKGTAMLWAVLVMLMISLISGCIVFVDHIYYVREQEENYQVQAQLYAESAIELIRDDIIKEGQDDGSGTAYESPYVSADNTTETVEVQFPDASNWTCTVTISHSVVDSNHARTTGTIYLTAKVTRDTTGGENLTLAEVCAKIHCESGTWTFDGYYAL